MSTLGNQEYIRDMNSRLVLQTIINESPISRADLAKCLGLTKATVSSIVQTLIDDGLVLEIGSLDTTKGRKPILLTFHSNCALCLSIDLSVDHMAILAANLRGENCILFQYDYAAEGQLGLEELKTRIAKTIRQCPQTLHGIIGICIGIHGIVHDNRIIFTPYYELPCEDMAEQLQTHFQIPVYVENEANLSAQGEKAFYYNYPNLINISIHSGIGLGIILNDRLYSGQNGYAGEFGHTIMIPNGRPCPCGNKGCFEQYASERAIVRLYRKLKNDRHLDALALCKAYTFHEPEAVTCINEFNKYMAIGINNILNAFNPDIIVINSVFSMNIPDLLPQIQGRLKNSMRQYCTLVPSMLQDMAILLGGSCVCTKQYLKITDLKVNRTLTTCSAACSWFPADHREGGLP